MKLKLHVKCVMSSSTRHSMSLALDQMTYYELAVQSNCVICRYGVSRTINVLFCYKFVLHFNISFEFNHWASFYVEPPKFVMQLFHVVHFKS